jgi:hypothetical protein
MSSFFFCAPLTPLGHMLDAVKVSHWQLLCQGRWQDPDWIRQWGCPEAAEKI